MQAQRDGEGRRPLIVRGDSRRMLQEINKSLSHVRQQDLQPTQWIPQDHNKQQYDYMQHDQQWIQQLPWPYQGQLVQDRGEIGLSSGRDDLGVRSELAKSTPNLAAASGGGSEKGGNVGRVSGRFGYHQRALAQIRQSLQEFEINDIDSSGVDGSNNAITNGYDTEITSVDQHLLMQLAFMGFDKELAKRALKLSGNKGVDAALAVIGTLAHNEGRNGFMKIQGPELKSFSSKVKRKPSFEQKYQTDSPGHSENSSIRSDSPAPGLQGPMRAYIEPAARMLHNTQTNLQNYHHMYSDNHSPTSVASVTSSNGRGQTPPPVFGPDYVDMQAGVVIPPSHMQHVLRGKAFQRDLANMRPHSAQSHPSSHLDPVAASHALSPAVARQGMAMAAAQERNIKAQHNSLYGYRGASLSQPNLAELSQESQEGSAMAYNQPPPYTQVMQTTATSAQLPGQPNQQSPSVYVYDQSHVVMSPYGMEGDDSSSLSSSLSPSPAPQSFGQLDIDYSRGVPHQPTHQPVPVHAWSAKQPQIFMLQAKSRVVQKPVLQTATTPLSPLQYSQPHSGGVEPNAPDHTNYVSSVQAQVNTPAQTGPRLHQGLQPEPQPPGRENVAYSTKYGHRPSSAPARGPRVGQIQAQYPIVSSGAPSHPGRTIQIQIQNQGPGNLHVRHHPHPNHPREGGYMTGSPMTAHPLHPHPHHLQQHYEQHPPFHQSGYGTPSSSTPRSESPIPRTYNQSPLSVISTTSTPSTNSDMTERPPPPYPGNYKVGLSPAQLALIPDPHRCMLPVTEEMLEAYSATSETQSSDSMPLDFGKDTEDSSSTSSRQDLEKLLCTSPKPELSQDVPQPQTDRQEVRMRHFSPQAFKFYMEQHVENIIKSSRERDNRRMQLEKEMSKIELAEEARVEMRKVLNQKESNYIRLKRAKMNKSMFSKIKTLGIGAFGEVALVCKKDSNQLYAMKTLSKRDVYQRNQVAHVKAERDILAEADNEWVVKLYYSFQDEDELYFVMDYIPGGDMMSLLIKFGIFEEPLAQFYIAELILAIESVHKMGFIHRDIKPDNILIDKNGHIKLTDFGLCTGFRWTHSSKIYQNGNHARQDSMEPEASWAEDYFNKEFLKPLEQRRRRGNQRRLAHSLVGTPNYIAPEVLQRSGYTSCCDWWSVGVILYEMLIGQPPFLASTPKETQQKVIDWAQTLHIPAEAKLSPEAQDLIVQLCQGPTQRLGRNGATEIKAHPFFREINFNGLRAHQAPYMPTIRHPTDTSNFDPVDQDKLRPDSELQKKGMSTPTPENGKHPDHAFFEFTFRRFFDYDGHAYAQKVQDPESNSPVYV